MRKYLFIGITILLLIIGIAYAYQHYSTLKERAYINEQQEEIQQELEKADIEHIQEKDRLYRELADRKKQITLLEKRYCDLEEQIANIHIPDNPHSLRDAFHRLGYGSAMTRPR